MKSFQVETSVAGDSCYWNIFLSHSNSRMRHTVHCPEGETRQGRVCWEQLQFSLCHFWHILALSASPKCHSFLKWGRKSRWGLRSLEASPAWCGAGLFPWITWMMLLPIRKRPCVIWVEITWKPNGEESRFSPHWRQGWLVWRSTFSGLNSMTQDRAELS